MEEENIDLYRKSLHHLIKLMFEYFHFKQYGPKTREEFLEKELKKILNIYQDKYGKLPILKKIK